MGLLDLACVTAEVVLVVALATGLPRRARALVRGAGLAALRLTV